MDGDALLRAALVRPETVVECALEDWDRLVRQAQRAGLAGRLHADLAARGLLEKVPVQPRRHLASAAAVAAQQQRLVHWEIAEIHRVLNAAAIPVVLLKGAAYVMAALPCARGRLFVDVDILVPRTALNDAELALFTAGWVADRLDAYDMRYYREWMHELPPLKHIKRQSLIDLHHTILPPTAALKPDPVLLLAGARPVDGYPELYLPCPADLILHSATHLFHEGEFMHGLRDLADLDDLLRHFAANEPAFWTALVQRAAAMDLRGPLYYALRYARRLLDTPVPEHALAELAGAGPGPLKSPLMDALFVRALTPHHSSCEDWLSPTARWLLYVRAHYLRMPLRLLVPHLVRKAWMRRFDRGEPAQP